MKKSILLAVLLVSILVLYTTDLTKSQEPLNIKNAPHYSSTITIEPHTDPELLGTYKCTVKLKNFETGEEISGPELVLIKGMENTAGTSHDWAHLDTFIKASCDKEGKTFNYSLDIFYKSTKIGNNSCTIKLGKS